MKNITVNEKLYLAEWVIQNNAVDIVSVLKSFKGHHKRPTLKLIIAAVCDYYDVGYDELKSESRMNDIVHARHVYLYLCSLYNYRTAEVYLLVNRDHSTYSHAKKKIGNYVRDPRAAWYDLELSGEIADIMAQLKFRKHV